MEPIDKSKVAELNGGVEPTITSEQVRENKTVEICDHGVHVDEFECGSCEALKQVEQDNSTASKQLSLIEGNKTTVVVPVVTPDPVKPKSTLTDEQKVEIIRQGLEHVAGFNGDVWKHAFAKPKNYVLQGNGLWCVVDRPFARLVTKINDLKFIGEYSVLGDSFDFKLPKVPGSFLTQILSFFRHYVIDEGITAVTEAMTQIYWDPIDKEHFIHIPKQEVTGARVTYLFTDADPRIKAHKCVKVWDIHSHNTMSSFFSGVDDADEQGQQFYGVIGNITKDSHTWAFRMGIDGHWAGINYQDPDDAIHAIFDMSSFTEVGTYPKEWEQRVSLQHFTPGTVIVGPGTPHSTGNKDWKDNYHGYYGGGYQGRYRDEWDENPYDWRNQRPPGNTPGFTPSWQITVQEKIDDVMVKLKENADIRHLAKKIVEDMYADKIISAIELAWKIKKAKRGTGRK